MLPVRCFSCNKVIGRLQDEFDLFRKSQETDITIFFNKFKIERYCCRKIFITYIDIYENCTEFKHEMIECISSTQVKKILPAI